MRESHDQTKFLSAIVGGRQAGDVNRTIKQWF